MAAHRPLGHAGDHVGIHDGDDRDIVRIRTDELAVLLHVGNDVVNRDLGRRAGGGGHRDDRQALVLGGGCALQRTDIRKLRVCHDDGDGLAGVDGAAAADGHDHIRARVLAERDALLHILDGGVGLDPIIDGVGNARRIEQVGHLGCNLELEQIRIRADHDLFAAAGLDLVRDLLDRPLAEVGCFI